MMAFLWWLGAGHWFSQGNLVYCINEIDHHNITVAKFNRKKYFEPKNENKWIIIPWNFKQEILVTFGEKLLIFHIHKTKYFALFAKKFLAGGKI